MARRRGNAPGPAQEVGSYAGGIFTASLDGRIDAAL
jgi:hypothetical protein